MLPGIIFIALSVMLFAFAYLLYFKEAYWLISGVNMEPRQTVRERYDLPGLTRHFGKMCALIGLVMLISGAGAWAGYETVFLLPIFLIFIILPVFLFGSERYILQGKKTQRILNVAITALMGIVAVFVVVMLVVGSKPPAIYIEDSKLVIDAMYGTEIPLVSVKKVDTISLEGKEIAKQSGFDAGDIRKGFFRVEGLGNVRIYQQGKGEDVLRITAEEKTVLIDLGSREKNDSLEKEILNAVDK